ncbi:MAG TPA: hypothetical protein VFS23_21900 [Vicinamibacterales bacterium]|nr:hypothetical protein [Vicinamibacterales bacterium]
MNRLKIAELTSGIGALVLGIGLGALFSAWVADLAIVITLIGLALHAFGMWDKHRLENASNTAAPPWVTAAYWVCWLLLVVVVALLVLR